MSRSDFSLNDFEIKSIKSQCPNFELKFERVEMSGAMNFDCTSIEILDKNGDFCKEIYSFTSINKSGGNWKKRDISEMIRIINVCKRNPIVDDIDFI